MTMFASRTHETSPNIKVSIIHGPVSASVEEHYQHLRHFHGELGRLLDTIEADEKAKVTEI